ncbi:hypothetical protein UG55_1016155 [Frankia sp. EI5c]|uniref:DUF7144 family membrane protein n=1 Tax=Frankia sp. EI5c TaxID=683316 RepID=UPI0007C33B62|nr:hypothetical protein [Frankia sp. EI5c]OAA26490.1 hypothetical protein UG55_1016155 [Frankia sp. EI5c]
MADLRQARTRSTPDGWLIFAAVIMFIVGFHNLIYGIAALRDYVVVVNNLTTTTSGDAVIYANTTFWGWLWIAVGIIEMGIAFGIAAGNELARWVGIVVAALNAIGQLAFLAAFPVWSVIIIAIDILVIYALATYPTRVRASAGVEPYPSDRPGAARPASARARTGALAGGGTRGGADAGGPDFFEPTAGSGSAGQARQTGAEGGYRGDSGYRAGADRGGDPGYQESGPGDAGYRDSGYRDSAPPSAGYRDPGGDTGYPGGEGTAPTGR